MDTIASAATSREKLDASSCTICGGGIKQEIARPASTYAARGTYSIATCNQCGSGQTTPRPDMRELEAFYAKDYGYDAHLLIEGEKRWRAKHILDVARPKLRGTRVLDIGCMYGYLLEEARAREAAAAIGVELSAAPARAAREKGLDVYCGTIESFAKDQRPRSFDLIVAQHVLEHVTDPASFLQTIRSLLAPDGMLCICVPNFDARARRVFREAWGWYQVPVHLHHFGARGLTEILEHNGFEVTKNERRGGDSLFVLLTLLQSAGRMPKSEDTKTPGILGRAMVKTASTLLRPYYFVGDDELLFLARPKPAR